MKLVKLPGGESVPQLGQGTWMIGEQRSRRAGEIAALQHGIDLGLRLIDTAEMYGEGASEELIGKAIRGRREQVFLVSKFYPQNASRRGAQQACERSLKRLGVDLPGSVSAALARQCSLRRNRRRHGSLAGAGQDSALGH
ncbi:aldo/keto reductase [Candidatus Dactylopiibacterium carminicum]|uniref:aldo/keto reductase n=1 Tax=Candidatus Dactylopiibacterium carminicum TaxID=857335 RepID=UPI0021DF9829|nr:aldo/keto reductase [Candidatus Dactylopiibacterium carminicum]